MPRTSLFALIVVVLALAATVISAVVQFWWGLGLWPLMAGVASNVIWMDRRRARILQAVAERG
ncbi:hypothetical protein [Streptomyces rubellomurinus]|uniref:Uncharacterized protein n=2 Tax=Streptomyces TaxID=1883 RepID=A0A0F2TD17_STRR3|nr:hypothetical protein [Streptomyces rubellomurinus]KJS57286.1 hypothetical protein VM98_02360 [Streptomyces rubellomurinus subsp. indigoferus]KJS60406.1 hypothetical protein VM95_21445 [Streptomyces rubellomurinus]